MFEHVVQNNLAVVQPATSASKQFMLYNLLYFGSQLVRAIGLPSHNALRKHMSMDELCLGSKIPRRRMIVQFAVWLIEQKVYIIIL